MTNKNPLLTEITRSMSNAMDDDQIRSISTTNRPRSIEHTDDMNLYYSAFLHAGPTRSIHVKKKGQVSYDLLVEYLKENSWELVRATEAYNMEEDKRYHVWSCWLKEGGLMITMHTANPNAINIPRNLITHDDGLEEGSAKDRVVDDCSFIFPMAKPEIGESEFKKFQEGLSKSYVSQSKSPMLGIISHDGGDYYVKTFNMAGKIPEFKFPDLHYGKGFENFHDSLLKRITEESKGLILLHGEPGTGKTQYIRVLLSGLGLLGKSVLYVPPSFSTQLTDPSMIEFISDWIISENRDCILLIEDAEPLLEIRNGADGRTAGITNLLNMTDGLLNDILGLMVIATFNTHITKIDPALLRAQRLVARKEFTKLSEKNAKELSNALGIDLPKIKYPASLAEFYTANKEKNILIHAIEVEEKKIGF